MLGPGWYAWRSCSAGRTKRAHSVTPLAYGSLSYDLVIKGGLVVTAEQAVVADVAVAGERIAAVGHELDGAVELDARGLYVIPGSVDGHVPLADPPFPPYARVAASPSCTPRTTT